MGAFFSRELVETVAEAEPVPGTGGAIAINRNKTTHVYTGTSDQTTPVEVFVDIAYPDPQPAQQGDRHIFVNNTSNNQPILVRTRSIGGSRGTKILANQNISPTDIYFEDTIQLNAGQVVELVLVSRPTLFGPFPFWVVQTFPSLLLLS